MNIIHEILCECTTILCAIVVAHNVTQVNKKLALLKEWKQGETASLAVQR